MAFENIEKMITDEVMQNVQKIDLKPIVKAAIEDMTPKTIEVKFNGKKSEKLGLQHYQFEKLLKYAAVGLSTYMVGPAGSGKTRAAFEVAKALDTEFYSESVCQQSSAALLKGYMDANGKYVTSNFRRAFEEGGIFLLDEIDAGNPNVLTALNAAVSVDPGQLVSFPDGMVKRHEKFICMAAANTFGTGADRQYVGRNPLDAASLDRFVFLQWGYDEVLESEIAKAAGISSDWFNYIKQVRKTVADLKIRVVVSPRATIFGGKMLQAGFSTEEAAQAAIFKGMDLDSANKIKSAVSLPSDNDKGIEAPKFKDKPLEADRGAEHGKVINVLRSRSEKKAAGGRGINTMFVCKAIKDSGSFSEGCFYIACDENSENIELARGSGPLAGHYVSGTNKSNFSRKFRILSGHDLDMYLNSLDTDELNGLYENDYVRRGVKIYVHG